MRLSPNQKKVILKATHDRDYCAIAHGNTLRSLVDKQLANYASGFGYPWGRIISLTDKGKEIQKKLTT